MPCQIAQHSTFVQIAVSKPQAEAAEVTTPEAEMKTLTLQHIQLQWRVMGRPRRKMKNFCELFQKLRNCECLDQIGGLEASYIRANGDISCSRDGGASRAN